MTGVDTSTEAVMLLANQHTNTADSDYTCRDDLREWHRETAATLRALAAERDAAVRVRDDAITRMGETARKAGSWQGIAEGKDIVIRRLEADRDRLAAAWLRVIQAENTCAVTGKPCDAVRCGCAAEQEMLLREAALATKEPGA